MAKKKRKWTFGQIFKLLDKIALAKTSNGIKIEGNKKLQLQRNRMVKKIEDMLEKMLKEEYNMTCVRIYKHLYSKKLR